MGLIYLVKVVWFGLKIGVIVILIILCMIQFVVLIFKTDADATVVNMLDSFNSNGFTLGQDNSSGDVNTNNNSLCSLDI